MNLNVSWYLPRRKYWRRKHGPLSEVVKWLPRDSKACCLRPCSISPAAPYRVFRARRAFQNRFACSKIERQWTSLKLVFQAVHVKSIILPIEKS